MDCAPDAYIFSTLRARLTLSRALSYPTDANGGEALPAAGLTFPVVARSVGSASLVDLQRASSELHTSG